MNARVQAVIETLADQRRRFERFSRSLSDEELQRRVPGSDWRLHDFIAHVVTLDGPYERWFAAIRGAARGPHRGSLEFDVDEFNAEAVAERRGRSVETLLAEAAQARAELLAELAQLNDEQLDTSVRFGGDRKRPPVEMTLERLLQGWAAHDAIHVADMLKALPERREDPEVRAWLDAPAIAPAIGAYQRAMG